MTPPYFPPSSSPVERFTTVFLAFVVFVCVTMIGGTGYLKYRLDQSQSVMAAPDSALASDQDAYNLLRRNLGYGGFLGLLQNYILSHDASGFAEMKAYIKSADEIVAKLPANAPPEIRRDMASLVAPFDMAMQRINAPAVEIPELSAADLTPLYAALPMIDARAAAANSQARLAAQNKSQFWGMLLTLISWCSLMIAAACAAGIYLILRDKHSAPMRALAQSIQNMARGDMRTAIWGIERQDMIGELARSVDIARYHFSHLPDMSLLSEQGPVRMRFEGGTRSLFEAMMKAISRDSETIREQTAALSETAESQKQAIETLGEKVQVVLQSVALTGETGDAHIRDAIREMTSSAEGLKNAHAHAADQINRLIPALQERAQSMSEIAQLTGKQVAQTLQSLSVSEATLKAHAEQAHETWNKLSSTADEMGERMFGAINLLQASGKILTETTEQVQSALTQGGISGHQNPGFDAALLAEPLAQSMEPLAVKLEYITAQLSELQNAPVTQGTEVRLSDQTLVQKLDQLVEQLADMQSATLSQKPYDDSLDVVTALAKLQEKMDVLTVANERYATMVEDKAASQLNMSVVEAETSHSALILSIAELLSEQVEPKLQALEASLGTSVHEKIAELTAAVSAKLEATPSADATQSDQAFLRALGAINDKLADLSATLPSQLNSAAQAGWQDLASQVKTAQETMAAALDDSFEKIIAGQQQALQQAPAHTVSSADIALTVRDTIASLLSTLPTEIVKQVQPDWQNLVAHIDTMHTQSVMTIEASLQNWQKSQQDSHSDRSTGLAERLAEKIDSLATSLPHELQTLMAVQWQDHAAQLATLQNQSMASLTASLHDYQNRQSDSLGPSSVDVSALAGKVDTLLHSIPSEIRSVLQPDLRNLASYIDTRQENVAESLSQELRKLRDEQQNLHSQTEALQSVFASKIDTLVSALPVDVYASIKTELCDLASIVNGAYERTSTSIDQGLRLIHDGQANILTQQAAQSKDTAHLLAGKIGDIVSSLSFEMQGIIKPDLRDLVAALSNMQMHTSAAISDAQARTADAILSAQASTVDAVTQAQSATESTLNMGQAQLSAAINDAQARTSEAILSAEASTVGAVTHAQSALESTFSNAQAQTSSAIHEAQARTSEAILSSKVSTEEALKSAQSSTESLLGKAQAHTSALIESTIQAVQDGQKDLRFYQDAQSKDLDATMAGRIDALVAALSGELHALIKPELRDMSTYVDAAQEKAIKAFEGGLQKLLAEQLTSREQGVAQTASLSSKIESMTAALPAVVRSTVQPDYHAVIAHIESVREKISADLVTQTQGLQSNLHLSLQAAQHDQQHKNSADLMSLSDKIDNLAGVIPSLDMRDLFRTGLQNLATSLREALLQLEGVANQNKLDLSAQADTLVARTEAVSVLLGEKVGQVLQQLPVELRGSFQSGWDALEKRLEAARAQIVTEMERQRQDMAGQDENLAARTRNALMTLTEKISTMTGALPVAIHAALSPDLENILGTLQTSHVNLVQNAEQGKQAVIAHTNSLFTRTSQVDMALGEQIATLATRLPADMRSLVQSDLLQISALVEVSRNEISALLEKQQRDAQAYRVSIAKHTDSVFEALGKQVESSATNLVNQLPAHVRTAVQGDLVQLATIIGSARDHLDGTLAQNKLDLIQHSSDMAGQSADTTRSLLLDHVVPTLESVQRNFEAHGEKLNAQLQTRSEEQNAFMNHVVAKIDDMAQALPPDLQQRLKDQWYQIASQIEASRLSVERIFETHIVGKLSSFEQVLDATRGMVNAVKEVVDNPPKITYAMPPELQRQVRDQWFQMVAQIEAMRTHVIENISQQLEGMESRLGDRTSGQALTKTASDYGTQRHIEQQTLILTELVSTLGILDSHMQQIKSEMHAVGK